MLENKKFKFQNEEEFANQLSEHIYILGDLIDDPNDFPIESVKTFKESMLLTNDNGLVFKMKDGSEFQVTIKKSK